MAFTASPTQLKLLKQAVDDYCRDCGIVDADERLQVAEIVSAMFDFGIKTLGELRRGLEHTKGRCPPMEAART